MKIVKALCIIEAGELTAVYQIIFFNLYYLADLKCITYVYVLYAHDCVQAHVSVCTGLLYQRSRCLLTI